MGLAISCSYWAMSAKLDPDLLECDDRKKSPERWDGHDLEPVRRGSGDTPRTRDR